MSDICSQLLAELNISNATRIIFLPPNTFSFLSPLLWVMVSPTSHESLKTENCCWHPPLPHHHQVDASPKSCRFLTWVPLKYTNSSLSPSLSSTLVLSLNYLYPSPEILVFYCFLASNSFLSSLFSMLQPEWFFFKTGLCHICVNMCVCVCVCVYIYMYVQWFLWHFFFH